MFRVEASFPMTTHASNWNVTRLTWPPPYDVHYRLTFDIGWLWNRTLDDFRAPDASDCEQLTIGVSPRGGKNSNRSSTIIPGLWLLYHPCNVFILLPLGGLKMPHVPFFAAWFFVRSFFFSCRSLWTRTSATSFPAGRSSETRRPIRRGHKATQPRIGLCCLSTVCRPVDEHPRWEVTHPPEAFAPGWSNRKIAQI